MKGGEEEGRRGGEERRVRKGGKEEGRREGEEEGRRGGEERRVGKEERRKGGEEGKGEKGRKETRDEGVHSIILWNLPRIHTDMGMRHDSLYEWKIGTNLVGFIFSSTACTLLSMVGNPPTYKDYIIAYYSKRLGSFSLTPRFSQKLTKRSGILTISCQKSYSKYQTLLRFLGYQDQVPLTNPST